MCKLLSVKAAAARASVSPSLIYKLVADGDLPAYRPGQREKRGKVLVAEEDLDRWLESRRREGPPDDDSFDHLK